ncbi:MAG: hypothetical protein J1E06_05820 [Acutalibacter sp.]|nr:hypothetical protein [Acutalibacter sp.]
MTRKRFVKLLMSYGFQRNEAQWIAGFVAKRGSYGNVYSSISRYRKILSMGTSIRFLGKRYAMIRGMWQRAAKLFGKEIEFCFLNDYATVEDQDAVIHHIGGKGRLHAVEVLTREEHWRLHNERGGMRFP